MSTLHHLEMASLDLRERLTKELQFSTDSERQILQALDTHDEAIDHAKQQILLAMAPVQESSAHMRVLAKAFFSERNRALATAIGAPGPQPETIEQHAESGEHPARKPKLVKAAAAAGGEG